MALAVSPSTIQCELIPNARSVYKGKIWSFFGAETRSVLGFSFGVRPSIFHHNRMPRLSLRRAI